MVDSSCLLAMHIVLAMLLLILTREQDPEDPTPRRSRQTRAGARNRAQGPGRG